MRRGAGKALGARTVHRQAVASVLDLLSRAGGHVGSAREIYTELGVLLVKGGFEDDDCAVSNDHHFDMVLAHFNNQFSLDLFVLQ